MTITIRCKKDSVSRKYEEASITYIDNGIIRFVNITDSHKWTNSYKIEDIELLEVR